MSILTSVKKDKNESSTFILTEVTRVQNCKNIVDLTYFLKNSSAASEMKRNLFSRF